jgi:hypothetical protein
LGIRRQRHCQQRDYEEGNSCHDLLVGSYLLETGAGSGKAQNRHLDNSRLFNTCQTLWLLLTRDILARIAGRGANFHYLLRYVEIEFEVDTEGMMPTLHALPIRREGASSQENEYEETPLGCAFSSTSALDRDRGAEFEHEHE